MSTVPSDSQALRRFAAYYGFEHGLLSGDDPYWIEGAKADFSGKVKCIRLIENGRFGNVFMQLLHATTLARLLGCDTIQAFAFEAGPKVNSVESGGLRFCFPCRSDAAPPNVPTLAGHFFNSYPFESALRALPAGGVWELVQATLLPLFRHIWAVPPGTGESTAVVHFRAGDIFSDPRVSPWYTQPPASYYTTAIAHLRDSFGIADVRLVFEDRSNPAIDLTETWLRDQAIPFSIQSSDLESDAACLATATHLVASVSTLAEVAAMLSQTLRTYVAFRQVESHHSIHQRTLPLIADTLRRKGVQTVLVQDSDGAYTATGAWVASAEQLRRLVDYPASALAVSQPDHGVDALQDPDLLFARLKATETEAARLRESLVRVQDRLNWLEQSRGQRFFRQVHAVRQALGLSWLGEPERN
jgi:hypothetical protein